MANSFFSNSTSSSGWLTTAHSRAVKRIEAQSKSFDLPVPIAGASKPWHGTKGKANRETLDNSSERSTATEIAPHSRPNGRGD